MKELIKIVIAAMALAGTGCVLPKPKNDFVAVRLLNCYTWEEKYGTELLLKFDISYTGLCRTCAYYEIESNPLYIRKEIVRSLQEVGYQNLWCADKHGDDENTNEGWPQDENCKSVRTVQFDACQISTRFASIFVDGTCADLLKKW